MQKFSIISVLIFAVTLLISHLATAQNTVGLLSYDAESAYDGYNLMFPHNQSTVFLINNCGEQVHIWEDSNDYRPGNAVYLLENGNLVKCKRNIMSAVNDPIWAGGGGETVEIRDWDNNLLHSFTLNDSLYRLHHDVAPLPNGNILMVVWEKKNYEEAVAAGRDTALLPQGEVWSEAILEWNPELDSIVWSWHVWDHLVQDYDSNAEYFGSIADNPRRININYDEHDGHPDWLHINSIAYNPVLDQFALSVPYFNELWVVDHSISREEASGPVGDLLYRWGNPAAYNQGTIEDKKQFFQHDVHWVNPEAQPGDADFGYITLFNNRVTPLLSTVNILDTSVEGERYSLINGRFTPADFTQTITHPTTDIKSASASVSSVQKLPNGNMLICAGRWGYGYELTPAGELTWEYIVPLKGGSPVEQGTELEIGNNLTFRIKRYGLDYLAFAEKDLTPQHYIELNPDERFCTTTTSTTNVLNSSSLHLYPNPATDVLTIEKETPEAIETQLYDAYGRLLKTIRLTTSNTTISLVNLNSGFYFIRASTGQTRRFVVQR